MLGLIIPGLFRDPGIPGFRETQSRDILRMSSFFFVINLPPIRDSTLNAVRGYPYHHKKIPVTDESYSTCQTRTSCKYA